VERVRAEGRWMCAELSERDRDTDKQERRERIRESRYNRKYERCMTEMFRDLDAGTRKERTDIGRKERREVAGCAVRTERRSSTCGAHAAK
jgi:hypothetical protein